VASKQSQFRYARTPESLLHDRVLSGTARLVYVEMALHVWQGSVARIGQRRIAQNLGFSRGRVSRGIEELAERGHVTVTGTGQSRRTYVLKSPVFSQKQGRETVVVSSPSGGRRYASVGSEVKGA